MKMNKEDYPPDPEKAPKAKEVEEDVKKVGLRMTTTMTTDNKMVEAFSFQDEVFQLMGEIEGSQKLGDH